MCSSKENNQSGESDILLKWYRQGLHNILEKVVFSLPPRTVFAFKEVKPEWCQVIHYFYHSKVPRMMKIQEKRRNNEWSSKNPIIQTKQIENCLLSGMIEIEGDDVNVFVSGNDKNGLKIFVLDAETFKVTHILDAFQAHNDSVNFSIDNRYLSVTLITFDGLLIIYTRLVWDRQKNYSLATMVFNKSLPTFYFNYLILDAHLAFFTYAGFLFAPIESSNSSIRKQLVYEQVSICDKSAKHEWVVSKDSAKTVNFYPFKKYINFFALSEEEFRYKRKFFFTFYSILLK